MSTIFSFHFPRSRYKGGYINLKKEFPRIFLADNSSGRGGKEDLHP